MKKLFVAVVLLTTFFTAQSVNGQSVNLLAQNEIVAVSNDLWNVNLVNDLTSDKKTNADGCASVWNDTHVITKEPWIKYTNNCNCDYKIKMTYDECDRNWENCKQKEENFTLYKNRTNFPFKGGSVFYYYRMTDVQFIECK